jgi:hypothetical protein
MNRVEKQECDLMPDFETARGERRLSKRHLKIALFVCIGLLTVSVASVRGAAAQSDKSVVWNTYDVTLDLRNDGSYHVTERQEIDFQGGPFSGGFADIPL